MRGLSYNGRPVPLFVCDCESSSKFAQLSVEDVVLGGSTLVLCSGVARIDQLRFESIALNACGLGSLMPCTRNASGKWLMSDCGT
jgi:hypothetical protein